MIKCVLYLMIVLSVWYFKVYTQCEPMIFVLICVVTVLKMLFFFRDFISKSIAVFYSGARGETSVFLRMCGISLLSVTLKV